MGGIFRGGSGNCDSEFTDQRRYHETGGAQVGRSAAQPSTEAAPGRPRFFGAFKSPKVARGPVTPLAVLQNSPKFVAGKSYH